MSSISGTIRIGEATAACGKIGARLRGSLLWVLAASAALGVSVTILADLVESWVNVDIGIPYWIIAIAIVLPASIFVTRKYTIWRFRRKLTTSGTPLDMPMRFELTSDALLYSVANIDKRATWTAVSEIFHAKGYWIFLVQSEAWFAPDHFFANDTDKRAFLREALSHMSEAARARSGDAVTFVGTAS